MQKILIALCVTLLNLLSAQAQNPGKNITKVNLSSFATKGFNVQYERQVSKRLTVAMGYGSIPYDDIAFKNVIEQYTNNADVQVGSFQLGTSILTPELRYYVGKKGAFRGFYFAPYGRFSTYKMQVPIEYSSGISNRTALFNGEIKNSTGGIMLGSQFKLSSRIYLDWWIVGASIGSAKGNLIASTSLNTFEQQELRDQLAQIDIPFTEFTYKVDGNGATVTTTGSMIGARGLGINLGFRF